MSVFICVTYTHTCISVDLHTHIHEERLNSRALDWTNLMHKLARLSCATHACSPTLLPLAIARKKHLSLSLPIQKSSVEFYAMSKRSRASGCIRRLIRSSLLCLNGLRGKAAAQKLIMQRYKNSDRFGPGCAFSTRSTGAVSS